MGRPVFLAAPDRGAAALGHVESLLREMQVQSGGALKGSDWWVPHLQSGDVGVDVDAPTHFARCMAALEEARVVVAVLDGAQADDQTAFLVGCALAAGKPVVALVTDGRAKAPLLEQAATHVARDARELSAALATLLAGRGGA